MILITGTHTNHSPKMLFSDSGNLKIRNARKTQFSKFNSKATISLSCINKKTQRKNNYVGIFLIIKCFKEYPSAFIQQTENEK